LLLGTFVKDVSAYLIRNPRYEELQNLFTQILATEFHRAPKSLRSLLAGRALQCATLVIDCDIVPRGEQGDNFKQAVMKFAFNQLCNADGMSVQLMAIRTLVRFARRVGEQQLVAFEQLLGEILKPLLTLLDQAPLDCKYLPIEAISTFSKLNEQLVAQMSPQVTPKLLQLFRDHHSEGDLGSELVNLFKKWCNF